MGKVRYSWKPNKSEVVEGCSRTVYLFAEYILVGLLRKCTINKQKVFEGFCGRLWTCTFCRTMDQYNWMLTCKPSLFYSLYCDVLYWNRFLHIELQPLGLESKLKETAQHSPFLWTQRIWTSLWPWPTLSVLCQLFVSQEKKACGVKIWTQTASTWSQSIPLSQLIWSHVSKVHWGHVLLWMTAKE